MTRTFRDYARSFGAVVAAGATALSLSWFLDSVEPTVIKTYTDKGREITLLDYDGDLLTVEERLTIGRFPAFGSEPPVGGYTEKREFEPARKTDRGDVNTEISFYDKDKKRVDGPIRTLEPRDGRLEIPEEKQEAQPENWLDELVEYLSTLDLSKFNLDSGLFSYARVDDFNRDFGSRVSEFDGALFRDKKSSAGYEFMLGEFGSSEESIRVSSRTMINGKKGNVHFSFSVYYDFPERRIHYAPIYIDYRSDIQSGYIRFSGYVQGDGIIVTQISADDNTPRKSEEVVVGRKIQGLGRISAELLNGLSRKYGEVVESEGNQHQKDRFNNLKRIKAKELVEKYEAEHPK